MPRELSASQPLLPLTGLLAIANSSLFGCPVFGVHYRLDISGEVVAYEKKSAYAIRNEKSVRERTGHWDTTDLT